MKTRKERMVRIPRRDGEEEGSRMDPDSSDGIYVTESVESDFRLIAQNRHMREKEKIKMMKLNDLKRSAHMNQRGNLFKKLVKMNANIPMT